MYQAYDLRATAKSVRLLADLLLKDLVSVSERKSKVPEANSGSHKLTDLLTDLELQVADLPNLGLLIARFAMLQVVRR